MTHICYVYVLKNKLDITIIKQGRLILYNSFTFTSKEDFFILYTLYFRATKARPKPYCGKVIWSN